jgi:hypothetical protein
MKKLLKDFVGLAFALLIILPAFWLLVKYGALHERVKELYYRAFNIPYYKGKDKFDYYVKRTDR